MKVASAGRLEGRASATFVMTLPRTVTNWLWRAEPVTPSIRTPARINVTGPDEAGDCCAGQTATSNKAIQIRLQRRKAERFTTTLRKGRIVLLEGGRRAHRRPTTVCQVL